MVPALSIFIIFVTSFGFLSDGIESAPNYNYHYCPNGTTFSPNSTYKTNLNKVLSALSSNATTNKNGFFNISISTNSTSVYGLYMCRGDVTVDTCSTCVSYVSKDIVSRCPQSNVAYIWYDECALRYSDANIFGSGQEDPQFTLYTSMNISNPNQLAQFIGTTLAGEMASQAAGDTSGKKFATKEANFSSLETVYSLVQCTPDLTVADCTQCLQTGASNIPSGTKGSRALLPSCNLRYETHPFYNATASPALVPTPSPPLVPPPSAAEGTNKGKLSTTAKVIIGITVPLAVLALLLAAGVCIILTKRAKKTPDTASTNNVESGSDDFTAAESLQYDLKLLQAATNNFSNTNKIGEGGFGGVYQGKLTNGDEIAVKRLSQRSTQGGPEFKNEVMLVAKLQHRNLVRLVGFCLAGDEKLLVYEFVPNKSLDYFLFDPEKKAELDWKKRYKIIQGIARGLLYLHKDSRLRIIHRDIKPSNILLDADMTPKISDFGLAKILGIDQSQGNTKRVAGTYGYMAPEYAFNGDFSESSDVYSYGVLVLEIISGQKINNFRKSEYPDHLMSYAWKKWKENEALEMIDQDLRIGTDSKGEVIRCIHLALLCVQEDVVARPSMSTVVMTLSYHSVTLPQPQIPAFYSRSKAEMSSDAKPLSSSVNFVSITDAGPR